MSDPTARLCRRKKGAIMKIAYAITTDEPVIGPQVSRIVVPEGQDPTEHPCFFGRVINIETLGYVS